MDQINFLQLNPTLSNLREGNLPKLDLMIAWLTADGARTLRSWPQV